MQASIFDLNGKEVEKIDLPKIFETEFRPDIIRRAALSVQLARRQPYGPDNDAGKRTTALNWGIGRGAARVPRVKGSQYNRAGKAAFIGFVVGGSVTHPPIPSSYRENIIHKERLLAIRSAIAATADPMLVESRGHIVSDVPKFPLIVTDDFQQLKTTKEVIKAFSSLGLIRTPKDVKAEAPVSYGDIDKANNRMMSIRAGKGKRRGRKHKNAKSVLFVYGKDGENTIFIRYSARNLAGVDVVPVDQLNAELLAPGTHPGRLTVWSHSAIKQLQEKNLFY